MMWELPFRRLSRRALREEFAPIAPGPGASATEEGARYYQEGGTWEEDRTLWKNASLSIAWIIAAVMTVITEAMIQAIESDAFFQSVRSSSQVPPSW